LRFELDQECTLIDKKKDAQKEGGNYFYLLSSQCLTLPKVSLALLRDFYQASCGTGRFIGKEGDK